MKRFQGDIGLSSSTNLMWAFESRSRISLCAKLWSQCSWSPTISTSPISLLRTNWLFLMFLFLNDARFKLDCTKCSVTAESVLTLRTFCYFLMSSWWPISKKCCSVESLLGHSLASYGFIPIWIRIGFWLLLNLKCSVDIKMIGLCVFISPYLEIECSSMLIEQSLTCGWWVIVIAVHKMHTVPGL